MTEDDGDLVEVSVSVTYLTRLPRDPDAWEGAVSLLDRMAKEKEYVEDGGDYLFQAMSALPHAVVAEVRAVSE